MRGLMLYVTGIYYCWQVPSAPLASCAGKIASFVKSLTDVELVELLKSFKTMNIDLIKDLTNEAKERKIMSDSWEDESPFDKLIEGGIADK